jgi:hypothetical protein
MARAVDSKRNNRLIPVDSQLEAVEAQSASPAWEEIAGLAYSFWEARGYQGGSPEEDWFRAVQELAPPQRGTAKSQLIRLKAAKVRV